jgi:hypothetical protein
MLLPLTSLLMLGGAVFYYWLGRRVVAGWHAGLMWPVFRPYILGSIATLGVVVFFVALGLLAR